jgi:hypothetical protein
MRVLGRLAMAAALTIPIGMVAAGMAHASNGHTATCTGTSGSMDNILTNNGVGDNGGLLLVQKGPQQYKATAGGQTCTNGSDVTAARIKFVVTTATAMNCQTAISQAVQLGGSGTATWTAPAGMGTSNFNIRAQWTTPTHIKIWGSVSAGGSSNNIFGGDHITGGIDTTQSLLSAAHPGGSCTSVLPLHHFAITGITYKIS